MNPQQPRGSCNNRASLPAFRALLCGLSFLRLAVALTLLGAGVIHGAQIASHLDESRAAGVFFAGVGALQVALGVILLVSRSQPLRLAALVLSVGTIGVWVASRTVGIPGAHAGAREVIGVADAVATGLELLTALLAGFLLVAGPTVPTVAPTQPRHPVRHFVTAATMALAIAAVTAVALRPVSLHAHHQVREDKATTSGNEKLLELLEHHGSHEADHSG